MQLEKSEICKSLYRKYRIVFLYSLTLNNNTIFNKNVHSQWVSYCNTLVYNRHGDFFLNFWTPFFQFIYKSILIYRFKKSGTSKHTVNHD